MADAPLDEDGSASSAAPRPGIMPSSKLPAPDGGPTRAELANQVAALTVRLSQAERERDAHEAAAADLAERVQTLRVRLREHGDDPDALNGPLPERFAPSTPDEDEDETAFEPFPLEALPQVPRAYATAASRALDVPPAFVAVPMLPVLSAGVGASMQLELKQSWAEPATLWTALVAPSGSTKSAALRHALRPVYGHETDALERYEAAMARYDPDEDAPKPVRTRYRMGDPTPEAVVRILADNPRGVLLARDELAAWIGSFDRYAHGAADLQFWIEVWNGVQVSRDRVGDGNVTVPHPCVPLAGTIQPETLREKLSGLHFETGFASRLILCQPPTRPKTWTEADVTPELVARYGQLLKTLYALAERTDGGPARVGLSREAKAAWVAHFNAANERLHRAPDGPARAARAKAINHAARLALVFHCCRVASGHREPGPVDAGTLEAGIAVARWCLRETLRVYDALDLGAAALDPPERFLRLLPPAFTTAEAKEVAQSSEVPRRTMFRWLDRLQDEGRIEKVGRGRYRKTS